MINKDLITFYQDRGRTSTASLKSANGGWQYNFVVSKRSCPLTTDSYYGKHRDNKERNQDEKRTMLREKQSVGPSFFKFTVMGGARADMHVTHNFDNKGEPFGDAMAEIKEHIMIKLESFNAKKTLDKNYIQA